MKIEKEKRDPTLGIWLLIGLAAGAIIGYLTDNLSLSLGIGMVAGLAIGAIASRGK